jgi:SAM-dependent methyltransferase
VLSSIYKDSFLYDLLAPPDEAEQAFFCALAADAANVLEIASGCGALAARLALQAEVVGVDASEEMVRFSSDRFARQARVSFIQGDMRSLRLGRQFDLVLAVDNALQHACTDGDLLSTLESIKAHLGPRSRAVFQAGLRGSESIGELNHSRRKVGSVADSASDATFDIFGTSTYDAATRINHRTFEIYENGSLIAERSLTMRILDAAAMQAALTHSGLKIERSFDSFTHAAGSNHSPESGHAVRTYECRASGA